MDRQTQVKEKHGRRREPHGHVTQFKKPVTTDGLRASQLEGRIKSGHTRMAQL
jgi:hypothetical protein